ncbi:MAG: hypothetical protein QMD92_08175, partial [bacterium]|nr:hypothetical protein [bacterium]
IKVAGDASKEAVVNAAIEALEKAGYTLAATTLKAAMRIDVLGAFNAISLGDPTDVAGLLRRKGDEFRINLRDDIVREQNLTWPQSRLLDEQLKNAVDRNIQDYLDRIKYNQLAVPQQLIFPESIKFEYINGEVKIIEKR